ncbi:MAG: VanZ family protein [Anaerolineales bacterium]
MIDFNLIDLFAGLGLLIILLPIIWWRKRTITALLFFSLFWVYLLAVIGVVIFPIVPDPNFSFAHFIKSINIMPFNFGPCQMHSLCFKSIMDNLLLTIPFGFGMTLFIHVRRKYLIWIALAMGFGLELTQFVIGILWRSSFRVVDINDVILNSSGVLIGYAIFKIFAIVIPLHKYMSTPR